MFELMEPFTTMMDLRTGELHPEREVGVRTVGDMDGWFLEPGDVSIDEVVYTVSTMPVPARVVELQSSTTRLRPGTVGDEYFMTKGHFHEKRDRSEIYFTVSGEGVLLMASEDGEHRVEPMQPGSVNYVPGGWAHRSVNVGTQDFVFLAVYVGDAGQDYATILERGFPVRIVRARSGPGYDVVENPRYRKE